MKRCTQCSEDKPFDAFRVYHCRNGRTYLRPLCRICERVARRKYHCKVAEREGRSRPTLVELRERQRLARQERALQASARKAEREARAMSAEESAERQREYWRRYQRRRRRFHRMRSLARRAVQHAVERGELIKARQCRDCGRQLAQANLHGHHFKGYAPKYWLDVVWVCVGCHKKREGGWGGQLHSKVLAGSMSGAGEARTRFFNPVEA